VALELVLSAAGGGDPEVRSLGVKLAANKLLERPDCEGAILAHAAAQLRALEAAGEEERWRDAEGAGAGGGGAADGAGGGGAEGGEEQPQEEGQQQQQQQKHQEEEQQPAEGEEQKQQEQQQRQDEGEEEQAEQEGAEEEAEDWRMSEEEAARHCTLYLALCAKRPSLLPPLLRSFGLWPAAARAAVVPYARSLMRALAPGPLLPEVAAAVAEPPEGARPLLLAMLHSLADLRTPQPKLVAAAVEDWKRTGGVRPRRGRARLTAPWHIPPRHRLSPHRLSHTGPAPHAHASFPKRRPPTDRPLSTPRPQETCAWSRRWWPACTAATRASCCPASWSWTRQS
jgi:flagellar motor protein MotB